ncbi:MAG: HAMP domain-containing histidine kinase [Myxococcales bacterium]|nr:MAG: HAMP domain-containing histidine kinase [Myxococcales bacterium]
MTHRDPPGSAHRLLRSPLRRLASGVRPAILEAERPPRPDALPPSVEAEVERRVQERTEELEAALAFLETSLGREQQARRQAETERRNREELVTLVSHELRNPLQAVLSWAQFSQDSTDAAELRQSLQEVERNARTMAMLVDDLLERASMLRTRRPLVLRPVDLSALLERVCRSFEPLRIHAGVRMSFEAPGAPLVVAGNAPRLEQVFLNLLANALTFTPPAGAIGVRLDRDGRSAVVRVSDSGPGIAPERLAQIFEHSFHDDRHAHAGSRGLGLGLTVVKHLTEAHGGSVEARSPGQGSTFVVRLPLASRPRSSAPQA